MLADVLGLNIIKPFGQPTMEIFMFSRRAMDEPQSLLPT